MYKNCKKEDYIKVVCEIGEEVPDGATIITLKEIIENSKAYKNDADFVKELIASIVEDRKAELKLALLEQEKRENLELERIKLAQLEQEKRENLELERIKLAENLELERIKLAQLEQQVLLEGAKNGALSVSNGVNETDAQPVVSLENLIKSVKTLSLPVPSRPENFNLFFQTIERAFVTKNVSQDLKAEILLNILGEKCNNVLLYLKEGEIKNYDKIKELVLREFQPTPQECWNNFKKSQRHKNETCMQFTSRLMSNFEYYLKLRNVDSFESLCELIVADKLFETLERDVASHIAIKQGQSWFKPVELAKEVDIFYVSKGKPYNWEPRTPTENYNRYDHVDRRERKYEFKKTNSNRDSEKLCYICNSKEHFARACDRRHYKQQQQNETEEIESVIVSHSSIEMSSLTPNQNDCTSDLKYVNALINGTKIKCLIDSGAQISVVNSNAVSTPKYIGKKIRVIGCFSSSSEIELAEFEINLEGKKPQTIVAATSDKLITPCILSLQTYQTLMGAAEDTYKCLSLHSDDDFKNRRRDYSPVRKRTGYTVRKNRVFVSNIPYECRWMEIKDLFREKVGDVAFVQFFEDDGKFKGCGIVEFKDNETAQRAVEIMHKHEIRGRLLNVKIDSRNTERRKTISRISERNSMRPSDRFRNDFRTDPPFNKYGLNHEFMKSLRIGGPLNNKVFVSNLDYKVTEKKLEDIFKIAGKLVKVELNVDNEGKSKGHGTAEYEHPLEAVQAISMFNGQRLYDRIMNVRMDKFADGGHAIPAELPSGLRGIGKGLGINGQPVQLTF